MSEQIKTIKDEHGEFLAGDYYDMNAGHCYCGVYMPEHAQG